MAPSSQMLALLRTSPVICTAGSSLNAFTTCSRKLGFCRLASATCASLNSCQQLSGYELCCVSWAGAYLPGTLWPCM